MNGLEEGTNFPHDFLLYNKKFMQHLLVCSLQQIDYYKILHMSGQQSCRAESCSKLMARYCFLGKLRVKNSSEYWILDPHQVLIIKLFFPNLLSN